MFPCSYNIAKPKPYRQKMNKEKHNNDNGYHNRYFLKNIHRNKHIYEKSIKQKPNNHKWQQIAKF